jgi:hypothetical protein
MRSVEIYVDHILTGRRDAACVNLKDVFLPIVLCSAAMNFSRVSGDLFVERVNMQDLPKPR